MQVLSLDLETYSPIDIKKSGAYAYAAHPKFEILLLGYAFDDDPVQVVDLASGDRIPRDVEQALFDNRIKKTAYNAQFERICLAAHYNNHSHEFDLPYRFNPEYWSCTMVHGLYLGLPGNLAQLSAVLIKDADKQKMAEGKNLIPYFCSPVKPTKTNGGRTRNLPQHDPEKWERFKQYNARDVEVEREIRQKLSRYPLPAMEQKLYALDQEINDRGVRVDMDLVRSAIELDRQHKEKTLWQAMQLTGLNNPASVAQLKTWLFDNGKITVDSLNKETVKDLIQATDDATIKQALELRQELAKTSVKKYAAIQNGICPDGRVHGLLQFYGAGRTGRWAGRLVQVHNLPQNHLKDLELARDLVKDGNLELIELLYGSPQNILSQLIRTAFIPKDGCQFIVSDFSAIEARVIAWLAGEQWRMEVFRTHGKIYEASASAMFHVPIEQITKGNPLRQKGKVAELALGYQGAAGALITMGALKMGLTEEELPGLVAAWRKANPKIVQLWADVQDAAITAVQDRCRTRVGRVSYFAESGFLFAELPSGRKLAYARPKMQRDGRFERLSLTYEGIDDKKQWGRIPTYGGKLVENLVQAIARDCLAEALLRCKDLCTVMHIHDEIVIEAKDELVESTESWICEAMDSPISWAPGLPLRGDGFTAPFYKKDD